MFVNIFLNSKDLNILFVMNEKINSNEDSILITKYSNELKSFYPLNLYTEFLKFEISNDKELRNSCKISDYNIFQIDTKKCLEIIKYFNPEPDLIIFIIKSKVSKGQGGNIGKEIKPVIMITSNAKNGVLSHEFSHSIFELGDEYGGIIPFPPTEIEIKNFKNLSLSKSNHDWIEIKKITNDKKIGFYEGGLGRNTGVYHSYPVCLMQNINETLCPVCLYYSIKKMNSITGKQITFIDINKSQ
jgi:hypothetical protein